jgi:uncharacterized Fe-S cluster-containing protein
MSVTLEDLPGLDCGLCGSGSCAELIERMSENPDLARRCIYLDPAAFAMESTPLASSASPGASAAPLAAPLPPVATDTLSCAGCTVAPTTCGLFDVNETASVSSQDNWADTLGREYDFVLEHFPEDPGPREIILPHNPLLTRELEIQVGDVLVGRPLGMSCGCPITHCGVTMQVDHRTGVIVWCVTGPLRPREEGYKDLGYYVAEGYEGLIKRTRREIKIGLRYFFQPERCMLQWRHSGLVNYMSRTASGLQVRVEGLWIG